MTTQMRQVTINVEQRHIDQAIKLHSNRIRKDICQCCPIALAAQEALNDPSISVAETIHGDNHVYARLPAEVIKLPNNWYTHTNWPKLQPFSFVIEVQDVE